MTTGSGSSHDSSSPVQQRTLNRIAAAPPDPTAIRRRPMCQKVDVPGATRSRQSPTGRRCSIRHAGWTPSSRSSSGDAWPVRYIDTTVVADGDVPVQDIPEGRRAAVGGYTLTIGADSNATVLVPAGRTVTVQTA
jgi:hypothetical protein